MTANARTLLPQHPKDWLWENGAGKRYLCRRPAEHWNSALTDAGRLRITVRGQGAGSWGAATKQCRESRQLQHHDDNRKLQIDVHARMRVAGHFRAAQVQGKDVGESAQAKV